MLYTFIYTRVAVLVRHWFEIGLIDGSLEHGARIELRLLEPGPRRGSESAAQRFVIDEPVWRADLFDRLDQPAGTYSAAHFHPFFTGNEPCERVWRPEIKMDPWTWAAAELSDIALVCEAAGVAAPVAEADAEEVRAQAELIVDTARSLAPEACTSAEQCYGWTRDVTGTVRLMVQNMSDPSLLDREAAAPWLAASVSGRG